jgi:DNA polymerase III delta subunit
MLHLLYGPDDYTVTTEAQALIAHLAGGDSGAVVRLDGATVTWAALQEACLTMPLFAPAQVVLARGLLGAWTGRGEGGKVAASRPSPAELAAFVRGMPDAAHLILLEGDLAANNRYLKELSGLDRRMAAVRAFAVPQGADLRQWIARRVQARGGTIEPAASSLLAERAGAGLWAVANEIDKLLAYTAPACRIATGDVEVLVPASEEASGFELVDAVGSRDPRDLRRVVDLTERLLAAGQAPEQVLALLGVRVRDLLLLAAGQQEGLTASEVGARAGWNPGRLAHLQRARNQFSARELANAQALLVAADLALKSRPAHERPQVLLLTVLAIAQRRPSGELEVALAL